MPPKKRLKSLGGESMSKFLKKDETNETEAPAIADQPPPVAVTSNSKSNSIKETVSNDARPGPIQSETTITVSNTQPTQPDNVVEKPKSKVDLKFQESCI